MPTSAVRDRRYRARRHAAMVLGCGEAVIADGLVLGVHIAGDDAEARVAPICLPIDPCLVEAMASAFGDSIRWR
jgi:hypothetical protein